MCLKLQYPKWSFPQIGVAPNHLLTSRILHSKTHHLDPCGGFPLMETPTNNNRRMENDETIGSFGSWLSLVSRPSSPKAAPPKPRSRRSRRALLLDERTRLGGQRTAMTMIKAAKSWDVPVYLGNHRINMNQHESMYIYIIYIYI